MPLRTSILGTLISIIVGILITIGVSQNSVDFYGIPLIAACFLYSYIIHWIFFVHGYLFQTEHYFDAIGSFTFRKSVIIPHFCCKRLLRFPCLFFSCNIVLTTWFFFYLGE